jgi:hypothetical protein
MNDIFLTDRISIISTAYDEWSKLSIPVIRDNRPARVEYKNRIIHDKDGKEVISNMQVYLKPDEIIKYEDKISIDTVVGVVPQIVGKQFIIKKLDRTHGFNNFAIEVFL